MHFVGLPDVDPSQIYRRTKGHTKLVPQISSTHVENITVTTTWSARFLRPSIKYN